MRDAPEQQLNATLTAFLRPRRVLLVLDNCEHLIDACAAHVSQLLATCPQLRVLATSREPLQIAGERQRRVAPLALPESEADADATTLLQAPAARLFVERAQAVEPSFAVTDANAAAVGKHLSDGIRALQDKHQIIGDVRGMGLMIGIELVRDRKTKERAVEERNALVQAMFRRGVLVLGAGKNALRLAPPLVLSKDQASSVLEVLDAALGEVTRPR